MCVSNQAIPSASDLAAAASSCAVEKDAVETHKRRQQIARTRILNRFRRGFGPRVFLTRASILMELQHIETRYERRRCLLRLSCEL